MSLSVALRVSCQLGEPVLLSDGRDRCLLAALMLMPEASVDEDCSAVARKNNVRIARQVSAVKAKAVTKPVEQPPNYHLWLSVHLSDPRHPVARLAGNVGKHRKRSCHAARRNGT